MSDYMPFGEEWENNVCKRPKKQIAKLLATQIETADTLCGCLEKLVSMKMNGQFDVIVSHGQGQSEAEAAKAWRIAFEAVQAYRGHKA